MKKAWKVSGIMLTLLFIGMLALAFDIQPVKAEPRTIIVPHEYPTIQQAINAANVGDTIYVKSGIYYESLEIDKCLKLIGEGKETTIIDGSPITPELDYVIIFLKDMRNVYISGFTLRNGPGGIELDHSHNCTITDNIITMNYGGGIVLFDSNFNNLTGNTIASNEAGGIDIVRSDNNYVIQNNLLNNTCGLYLQDAYNNIIYHNCFLDNDYCPASSTEGSVNVWDNGYPSGGNYWGDYTGVDYLGGPYQNETGRDGIGDLPYIIDGNNLDNYPIKKMLFLYELLEKYNTLLEDYRKLNLTYHELLDSYSGLLADYDNLQVAHDSLNSTYNNLVSDYNNLQSSYDKLWSDWQETINELSTTRNLMYTFIATTIILTATTVYFMKRKARGAEREQKERRK